MRKGEHRHGDTQRIEGGLTMAACECGWSTRVPDKAEAERQLQAHQDKMNDDPDEGIKL